MGHYRFETLISAPPELVFELWTDLDRLAEWTEGVTRVSDVVGDPREAGSSYVVWFGRMASPTEVLEAAPPTRLRTRFGHRLLKGETTTTFESAGDRTRITQEFVVTGLFSRLLARIFASGSYRGSFRGELETFRRLAERDAAGSQKELSSP